MGRALLKLLGVLILIVILSVALLLAALQLPWGRQAVAALASEWLSEAMGQRVKIGRLEGHLPVYFSLIDVSISDGEEAWTQLDEIKISFRASALFSGQLVLDTIHVTTAQLDVDQARQWWSSRPKKKEGPDSIPWLWQVIAKDVAVSSFSLSGIFPQEPFKGSFSGGVLLDLWRERYTARSSVEAYGGRVATILSMTSHHVSSEVTVADTTGELLAHFFDLPVLAPWEVQIWASSSRDQLSEWLIGQALPDEEIITGYLTASLYGTPKDQVLASPWLSFPLSGKGVFSWHGDGRLTVTEARAISPVASLGGDITFYEDFSMALGEVSLSIEDIGALPELRDVPIAGGLVAQAHIAGALEHPEVQVEYQGLGWKVDKIAFDRFEGKCEAFYDKGYRGFTDVDIVAKNLAVAASTHFSFEKERLILPDLVIRQEGRAINGDLAISSNGGLDGDLQGGVARLQDWTELLEISASGLVDLKAHFSYSQEEKQQAFQGDAIFHDLKTAIAVVDLLEVKVSIPDIRHVTSYELHAVGKDLYTANNHLSTFSLKTTLFPGGISPFELSCTSKDPVDLTLKASGKASFGSEGAASIEVITLSGKVEEHPIFLQKAVAIKLGPQAETISIEELAIAVGEGVLQGDLHIDKEVALSAKMDRFPMEWMAFALSDKSIKGRATGDIQLHSELGVLRGEILCSIEGLQHRGQKLPAHVEVAVTLQPEETVVHLSIIGEEARLLSLEGSLPIQLGVAPYHVTIDEKNRVNAGVQGRIAVEQLPFSLLPANGYATGDLVIDLGLQGAFNDPQLTGQLLWTNGSYESYVTGVIFSDIAMSLLGEGSGVVLDSLSIAVNGGGKITGNGRMQFNLEEHMPIEMVLDLEEATLIDVDLAKATFSGHVQAIGNLAGVAINGDVLISEGRLTIPSKLPSSIPDLHPVFINVPSQKPTRPPRDTWELPVTFHVALHTDTDFFVSGRGLTSTWTGGVLLQGDLDRPTTTGTLSLQSGTYSFSGTVFTITKGEITFAGEMPSDMSLNVEAEIARSEVTIIALLDGPVTSPRVQFRSSPPRSTEEIVALMLFNKGVDEVSPIEALKLGQALLELSGESAGPDILGTVQSTLGLDRLGVTSSSAGDLTFQAGKYVLNGVLFSIEKDVYAEGANFNLETNLKRGFYLQGQYNQYSESKIFLKWRRRY